MLLTLKISMVDQQKNNGKDDWLPKRSDHSLNLEKKAEENKVSSISASELKLCCTYGQYALFSDGKITTLQNGQHILVDNYDITVTIEKEILQKAPEKPLVDNFIIKSLNIADSHVPKSPKLNNTSSGISSNLATKNNDDQLAFLYSSSNLFDTKTENDKLTDVQRKTTFLDAKGAINRSGSKMNALSSRERNILEELGILEKQS